jgi:mannan endo-1,4-beta-mannosidase
MGLSEITFRRLGGNRMTGYNWENNASNAGLDWNHQSDDYLCGVLGLTGAQCSTTGGVITAWHDQSVAMGAASELTLEMAGYVAADMNGPVAVNETAPSARWKAAPFAKGSAFTTSPSLTDGSVYMDEQVNFMVSRYGGAAAANGVKVYGLDNEPDLWSSTHPRIHPTPVGAAELVARSAALAKAVKDVDPNALVFGYESYGFNGYYSLQDAPDWGSVKGSYSWYIDYYLARMRQQGDAAGKRLLDGLSVHWYPEAQGGGQRIVFGGAGGVEVQKARVQAPRSLWDPTYQETSWIAQYFPSYLPLIPRLQASIDSYYPGTRLAFTEFAYGGESDVSGGLAVADALGIFGKYGVYAAAYWPVESDQSYVRAAYRLFRNYDGAGSRYGDTAVQATSDNNADASVYAAIAGTDDTELHIIVLNKNFDRPADFGFNLGGGGTYMNGEVWAFDASGPAITQRGGISGIANNHFVYTLRPRTAAHIVLHAAVGPTPIPTLTITPGGPTFTPTPSPTATATVAPTDTPDPANDLVVYGDALAAGWEDWSWSTGVSFANTAPVQSGTRSIALTYNAGWAGLSLRAPGPVSTAGYTGASFWVYGAAGGGQVFFCIQATDTGACSSGPRFTPAVGQWTQVTVPWSQLGNPAGVARLNWQEYTGSARPTFYIDNVRLTAP